MSPPQGSIRSKAERAPTGATPSPGPRAGSSTKTLDSVFEAILDKIRTERNFDFRNYKRATLRRRIERCIADSGSATPGEYLARLARDSDEVNRLLSAMLIKVTSFFRDGEPWEELLQRVLPQLIANRRPTEELRIWCAGCATGEEAFSVAILLAEVLGPAFGTYPVKVFGTDADAGAIAYARRAVYSSHQVRGLSSELLARWFLPCAEGFTVRKEIRRVVVFGVNNLVSDAPISRLDLLVCRNVFIYLDAELQRRVLSRFQYSLRRDGVLLLGKSELIPFAAKIFRSIDLARRLYRKDDQAVSSLAARGELPGMPPDDEDQRSGDALGSTLHRHAVDSIQLPLIATALDGTVTLWNRAAAGLWKRRGDEVVGKKLAALGLPGLSGSLLIEKTSLVRDGKSRGEASDGVVNVSGTERSVAVAIQVSPLMKNGEGVAGLLYLAQDVTPFRKLEDEMQRANDERRKANDELQLANEALQSSNEELETTNEELQSTNEELETTNEELQSTNEELETTNEELQSTNEELDTTNKELAHRTEELNQLSNYHRIISRSLAAAVVVLDSGGRVTMWNLAADRLLGLPEPEAVGQPFWSLGIPALKKALVKRLRQSLASGRAVRLDGVAYQLPTGSRGFASVAAVPFIDSGRYQGAVILLEDSTRATVLAEKLQRIKEKQS